ncbi:hypothetical protein Lal_00012919, partial [Lupinus albus]
MPLKYFTSQGQTQHMSPYLHLDPNQVVDISNCKGYLPWKLLNNWLKCKEILASMDYIVTHIFREGNDSIPQFLLYEHARNSDGMLINRSANLNIRSTIVLSGFPSSGANGKPSGSSNRNILQPTYLGAFGMANQ